MSQLCSHSVLPWRESAKRAHATARAIQELTQKKERLAVIFATGASQLEARLWHAEAENLCSQPG
jgi:hypothetical protein